MRQRGISRVLAVSIVAALCVLGVAYMVMQPVIPPPDERFRVKHPAGFSVIFPAGWDSTLGFAGFSGRSADAVEGTPVKVEGTPGFFRVAVSPPATQSSAPPGPNFAQETFDGQPAWVSRVDKPKTKEHSIEYIFERGGRSFRATITRPDSEPIEGSPWSDYVKSLRVDQPATRPSTRTGTG